MAAKFQLVINEDERRFRVRTALPFRPAGLVRSSIRP